MKHSKLIRLVDHQETYGSNNIREFASAAIGSKLILDIGAGRGRDLSILKEVLPGIQQYAVEFYEPNVLALEAQGVHVFQTDIERNKLPFSDCELDIIIANQVLEHTKEIFWIFHEMTRSLRVGGYLFIGVPNIASFHNRLLLLAGMHPTQHKLASAHVRPFSKRDTLHFLSSCFPGGYELTLFRGAQFYPFPPAVARGLSRLFPSAAFSIFFMLRKITAYDGGFIRFPIEEKLETNFWVG